MDEDRVLIGIDLSTASVLAIELLVEDSLDDALFREIFRVNVNRPAILQFLLEYSHTPDDIRQEISSVLSVPVKPRTEIIRTQQTPDDHAQTILQKVQKLNVSEKILLALRGGKEIRSILLRDPNKEVSLTVLENPKITETEVEMIAKSRTISDEALRKIRKKREWMKNYHIMYALVTNPKTPPGIALSLVNELKTRDLSILEKNKNVTEGIRGAAKKLVRARKG